MIEQRLADTLDRVTAAAPPEDGAFDRFLRHRARRSRRMAAATALCLSLALALPVVLMHSPGDRRQATPPVQGPADPGPWRPGPLIAEAMSQGFMITVPAGWEVNTTRQGFELRPGSADLRRQLPTPIQVGTFALDPASHPQGAKLFRDNNGFLGDISGTLGEYQTRTSGSFGGDRWWLRTIGGAPDRGTTWYTAWPYHCPRGKPCPDVLALRTLRVVLVGGGDRVRAGAMDMVSELLRTARPITNALAGEDHPARPACDGVTARPFVDIFPVEGSPQTVRIVWSFRTTPALDACHFRRRLQLAFLEGGRPVTVAGIDKRVLLDGNLPEGSPLAPGGVGMEWRWTNWCGGDVQIRFRGARVSAGGPPTGGVLAPPTAPACADPSKPSRLKIVEWGE
jgi:hypothetical protein